MGKLDDLDKQRRGNANDLEILEEIQAKIVEELRNKEINPRVGDLLKALELKIKLRLSQDDKEKIWELLNQLRDAELTSDGESDS